MDSARLGFGGGAWIAHGKKVYKIIRRRGIGKISISLRHATEFRFFATRPIFYKAQIFAREENFLSILFS